MAVRKPDGEIEVHTGEHEGIGGKSFWARLPFVRGVVNFVDSLVLGMETLTYSAECYEEEDVQEPGAFERFLLKLFGEKAEKVVMGCTVAFSIVVAVGIFIVLPYFISGFFRNRIVSNTLLAVLEGVIRLGLFVLYVVLISSMKDIKRVYMYHGAEHRTINCYEHNLDLTVENVQSCSTRHARCGTTFMFYTVMISVLVVTLVTWVLSLFGLTSLYMQALCGETAGKILYNVICMGIGLLCLPVIAGVSYEFLRLIAKAPDNAFFMIFKAPGFALQALTTKIPDDGMAEAAITAFRTVLEMDADPTVPAVDFYEMTVRSARKYIEEKYAEAGIDDPSEPDWLLCDILDVGRADLRRVEKLDKERAAKLKACVSERISGKPLDYVIGKSDFLGYELKVDERVHLPRMETETVALEAIKLIEKNGYTTALDLMTGSGCIARALAERTTAKITASDISSAALEVARSNLTAETETVESDCFESIDGSFDIIVSNPPYIRSKEIDGLQKEVTCQPRISLDGGEDGLDFYKKIAREAKEHLNDGGALVLEIGHDQASDVVALLEGYKDIKGNVKIKVMFAHSIKGCRPL